MFAFFCYIILGVLGQDEADIQLWKAWKKGENAAFGPLFERYSLRFEKLAIAILKNSDDAKDVVMEVFMDFLKKSIVERKKLHLKGRVVDYLQKAVKNKALKILERQNRKKPLTMASQMNNSDISMQDLWMYVEKLDRANTENLWKQIQQIANLTDFELKVWQLRLKRLSYAEISAKIGGNPGANATLHAKAKKKMALHKENIMAHLMRIIYA